MTRVRLSKQLDSRVRGLPDFLGAPLAAHHCSSKADPHRSSSIHLRSIDHRLVDPPIIPWALIVAS